MDMSKSEARVQFKERLLHLVRAGAAGGLVLASTTLSSPGASAAQVRDEPRSSVLERAASVRPEAAAQAAAGAPSLPPDSLLAWGNWGNWHNGWHNGWHNWHNWHNWW